MNKLMYTLFKTPRGNYVFDGNHNKIFKIDENMFLSLKNIRDNIASKEDMENLYELQKNGLCEDSYVQVIKHPEEALLPAYLDNGLGSIYLQVTQQCNLRCGYCAYSGLYENRVHTSKNMDTPLAKKAIDFFFQHSNSSEKVFVGFYGGEPLLRIDLIKKIVEYINTKYSNRNVVYPITTNGTLLNDNIVNFLANNNFNLTISLDGPAQYHDINRKFKNGMGSHKLIMENLRKIKINYPQFYKKITFNSVAAPNIIYEDLEGFFSKNELTKDNIYTWSTLADTYIDEPVKYPPNYFALDDYQKFIGMLWSIGKIELDSIPISALRWKESVVERYRELNNIGKLQKEGHPGGPCIPGKNRLFIDIEGNFYPCEKVSEKSIIMRIGNIDNGIDIEKVRNLINIAKCTEEKCKKCWCFANCTQCAANSDDLSSFPSAQKRLERCETVKLQTLEFLKDICFLKENNFDFQERILKNE